MTGRGPLDPAVAAVRVAVRSCLADLEPGERVLVACSGGPDSMALAAATLFEGARAGWQVGALVVDHGLQPDSADVASVVADRLRRLGPEMDDVRLDPVEVVAVTVGGSGGPEAAARAARYAALERRAEIDDATVLLGHTLDDQAETVLLGLARGSGLRSLAGMPARVGRYRRPLLGVTRAETHRTCAALRLETWSDPHNDDSRFSRTRVRLRVLPVLERELGPGVAAALARTAALAADDAAAFDVLAEQLLQRALGAVDDVAPGALRLDVRVLASALPAVRRRALRLAATAAGAPAGEVSAVHVAALDDLVERWHGQGAVDLPGKVTGRRWRGYLDLAAAH